MTLHSAHSRSTDVDTIAAELVDQIGADVDPSLVTFFCGHELDGGALSAALAGRYPGAEVIGCTTAGEFTERAHGTGGTSAVAFPRTLVPTVASGLADFHDGVAPGVAAAVERVETAVGGPLRGLDPQRYVGVALIDGMHGSEEDANRALGNAAPFLSFVGGSAGDDLQFAETRVFRNGEESDHGAAIAVLEVPEGFSILKSCSFKPTGHSFIVTKADPAERTVYELNGRPVLDAYAEAAGTSRDALDGALFMKHPLGIMIDDEPWIRSPQQMTDDGGLKFYCQILEGMEVELMESTDLVGDTRRAIGDAREELGGDVAGALLFNCILRRLELDATETHDAFLDALGDGPSGGFHTYGESWLGHINQTITGIVFA